MKPPRPNLWLQYSAAIVLALAGIISAWAEDAKENGTPEDSPSPTALLDLSYQEFDQTPAGGWRSLAADKSRRTEAAALIETYLSKHGETGLDRFQRANLHWHAAQLLAFAGETEKALGHIPKARLEPEPTGSPLSWNDYVAATEAFLSGDSEKLKAARGRMARQKPDDPNLPIVDSLIAHFGEPYATAYGAEDD